jgi:hypothetical protein
MVQVYDQNILRKPIWWFKFMKQMFCVDPFESSTQPILLAK